MKKSLLAISLVSTLLANDYQEWLKAQSAEYTAYKKSMDEEFADMLKKDWEAFNAMNNPSPFTKPKPKELPKAKEVKIVKKEIESSPKVKIPLVEEKKKPLIYDLFFNVKSDMKNKTVIGKVDISKLEIKEPILFVVDKTNNLSKSFSITNDGRVYLRDSSILKDKNTKSLNLKVVTKIEKDIVDVANLTISIEQVVKKDEKYASVDINFYSNDFQINYDKKSLYNLSSLNKDAISAYWEYISKTDFKYMLKQIDEKVAEYNLNDWAKYQLTFKIGQEIYKDENLANLFTWFILVKMGYDTKVGYSKEKVYLLSTMAHELYQIAFFKLKDKKYYVLTPNGRIGKVGSIYTYAGNYPKSTDSLSFEMKNQIKFYKDLEDKFLKFKYDSKDYEIKAKFSKDLVDFYKSFPQSDYNIYYNNKNSTPLSDTVLNELRPLLKGKTELEAVNFLLRFVQTSFAYKTDQQQFNHEKVMFPEETIFYPYSDCEDRSIMFTYLVKNLLGLDVVGVKYNDHMAAAVSFNSKVSGDGFTYKGKSFTITDPTYINANSGMAMPQYKNSKFDIIAMK